MGGSPCPLWAWIPSPGGPPVPWPCTQSRCPSASAGGRCSRRRRRNAPPILASWAVLGDCEAPMPLRTHRGGVWAPKADAELPGPPAGPPPALAGSGAPSHPHPQGCRRCLWALPPPPQAARLGSRSPPGGWGLLLGERVLGSRTSPGPAVQPGLGLCPERPLPPHWPPRQRPGVGGKAAGGSPQSKSASAGVGAPTAPPPAPTGGQHEGGGQAPGLRPLHAQHPGRASGCTAGEREP